LLFAHAAVDPACPRYVLCFLNWGAGAGHRLRNWDNGLWLAQSLPGLTFMHSSLDVDKGDHGSYEGMDELLGLTIGEGPLRNTIPDSSWAFENRLKDMGLTLKFLPTPADEHTAYVDNAQGLSVWGGAIAADAPGCKKVYRLPLDRWVRAHSDATRPTAAWKFAAAAAAREAAGARRALPGGPAEWDPAAIHVALHFRVNDGLLVNGTELAGVVAGTVAPALAAALRARGGAAAATRVALHVFTEDPLPAQLAPLLELRELAVGGGVRVTVHGEDVGVLDALYAMAHADVFVGSVSSLSWVVAHFGHRPVMVVQDFDGSGAYKWCGEGSVCCVKARCGDAAPLAAAAERLAAMAACGALNERSWEAPSV
jgi:hypothetical protein